MRFWQLGVVTLAAFVLTACEQKKPEPAMQQPEKNDKLSQMDNPPPANMDPYANDPYARDNAAKPSDTTATKKVPPKSGTASAKDEKLASGKTAGGRTHIVQKGETLSSLAQKYYGDKKKWKVIWDANKSVVPNKDKLTPGTKLTIP